MEEDHVDDGVPCREHRHVDADLVEHRRQVVRAFSGATLTLEDERPRSRLDCGEVPVQELLGLERLGCDARAFAQLENRLLRGRPVPAGTDDEHPVRQARLDLLAERLLDRGRQPRDVRAVQRVEPRDGAGVAHGVAPRAFDLGRHDHHLVDCVRERRALAAGDEPRLAVERAHGFERQGRLPFVRDGDEHVGLGRREDRLERLHRPPARLGRVERRAAPGMDDGRAGGQPPVGGNTPEPVGLDANRAFCLTRHRCLYTIAA